MKPGEGSARDMPVRDASVRLLDECDFAQVGAMLRARVAEGARSDLLLLDLCLEDRPWTGPRSAGARIAGLSRGGEIDGVLSLRPVVALDSHFDPQDLELCIPLLGSLRVSLLKCPERIAAPLWELLRGMGYHAEVDRKEIAFAVEEASFQPEESTSGAGLRPAEEHDLEALVLASRASLVEEGRPDTYELDPRGFRAWVRSRLARARVLERGGEVAFVAWADVARPEGWLVQGVYTWPDHRRRGLCAAGMSDLCREAFSRGADHVQLSVIDGNQAAIRLYERIGFQPFEQLRTVLFL